MKPRPSPAVGDRPSPSPHRWGWTDIIAVVAMLTSASLGLAGLFVSLQSRTTVDATRVEIGHFYSNSNGPDFDNPWHSAEERLTERVMFVGITRKVRFDKPFENAPKVVVSFSSINVAPLDLVMRETGYQLTDPIEMRRLREIQVGSDVIEVNPGDFTLRVTVGLPVPCGDHLLKYLKDTVPPADTVDIARRFGQLDPKSSSNQLTPQEQWMMNFYVTVGTLGVTWVARADQK